MKRVKKLALAVSMIGMLAFMTACGNKVMTATVDEVKDFMLVVKDGDQYYTVNFSDVKDGVADTKAFQVGDTVKITYTGKVTEVDGFAGEVLSLEKQ